MGGGGARLHAALINDVVQFDTMIPIENCADRGKLLTVKFFYDNMIIM